ncbi:MAG: fatty acid desaturase [Bacteroidales bacterium]
MTSNVSSTVDSSQNWIDIVQRYNFPDPVKSWWQVINSVVPYIGLWVLMYYSLEISYLLTLLLSVFAAGFLVRIFIIFHDCGHGSFFKSDRMCRLVGIPLGLMAFTPYHRWHRDHKIHHSTVGNLDERGIGDVKTMTVYQYLNLSGWKRFGYRFYRHPLFLLAVAPLLLFLIQNRIPKSYMNRRQHIYIQLSNIGIIAIVFVLIRVIGLKEFLMIQLPVIYLASVAGVWLFYLQHQFEDVIWTRKEKWDYKTLALKGSSFFKLPRILQWFTGNIGFHHVHHLSPRIPNYKLEMCHRENPLFQDIKPVTLRTSLRSLRLRLWDEDAQKLIGFSQIR